MERKFLEEHLIRGTADLPVGIYSVDAAKEGHIPLHYHREFEFLVVTHGKAKKQHCPQAVFLLFHESPREIQILCGNAAEYDLL